MREFPDIKGVLQTPEGKYLSGRAMHWRFTEDRSSAILFDLFAHRVHEQAAVLNERLGVRLHFVPLPPEEVYEVCDSCQCFFMPRQVFFDGVRFLCSDCKTNADDAEQPSRLAA